MTSFYQQRWKIYFEYLRNNLAGKTTTAPDFFGWEREWAEQHEHVAVTGQSLPSLEKTVREILF